MGCNHVYTLTSKRKRDNPDGYTHVIATLLIVPDPPPSSLEYQNQYQTTAPSHPITTRRSRVSHLNGYKTRPRGARRKGATETETARDMSKESSRSL